MFCGFSSKISALLAMIAFYPASNYYFNLQSDSFVVFGFGFSGEAKKRHRRRI
jgi:hypothetical protein